jgi:hypothetical protein
MVVCVESYTKLKMYAVFHFWQLKVTHQKMFIAEWRSYTEACANLKVTYVREAE